MKAIAFAALLPLLSLNPSAATAEDWNGWYVGLGVAQNSYTPEFNGTKSIIINGFDQPFPEDEGSANGAYLLGGRLWQRGTFVFGAELDLGGPNSVIDGPPAVDITEEFTFCGADPCLLYGTYGSLQTKGHLRGIVGLSATPRLLTFVGLGVAIAKSDPRGLYVRGNVDDLLGAAAVSRDNAETIYGASLGIGAQYKLNPKLTLRAEVVHDRFNHKIDPIGGVGFGGTAGDGTTINSFYSSGDKVKIESTTLRIAAIWEF